MRIAVFGKQKRVRVTELPYNSAVIWSICAVSDGTVIRSGETMPESGTLDLDCSGLHSWSPENPILYRLSVQDQSQVFGLVEYSVSQDHIYVNGDMLYIRGYIRGLKAHDHANFSFATKEEFYEKNILMAKSYGFNYVRWHSTIPDEEFLRLADKHGLLCHVEFSFKPIWAEDADGKKTVARVEFDEAYIADTVSRLSIHPCVAVYCVGNEIRGAGSRGEVRKVVDLIRSVDPSRLILDNCGWGEYDRPSSDTLHGLSTSGN